MRRAGNSIAFCCLIVLLLWTPQVYGVNVTDIRLVNTVNPNNRLGGRLEIQVDGNNVWGTVCDDKFDDLDAFVACRMLGFNNGGDAVLDGSFGTSSGPFLLDETACDGGEDSLSDCRASMDIDCNIPGDTQVGIQCNPSTGGQTQAPPTTTTARAVVIPGNCERRTPTVRLYGTDQNNGMGLVEVQNPNTGAWGFVCDDGWSQNAAIVVCAQLCYPTNYTAKPGVPAEFRASPLNPQIILDNVNCRGTEATLQDCAHSAWGVNDCLNGDGELAGVQCVEAQYRPPPAPVPILTCRDGLMIAEFSLRADPDLEEKHIDTFPVPCSEVEKSTTAQYVVITIGVNTCGTQIERNATFVNYRNTLKYDYTSQDGFVTTDNIYRISLECSLPISAEVTQRVQPLTEAVTQQATGVFQITMEVYRNDSFEIPVAENPVLMPMGSFLNMAVVLEQTDPRLKIVVPTCIATPNGDLSGVTRKVLFQDKCIEEPSLSFYPISNFKSGFRFRPFKFVQVDLLYIHCEAIVCLANSNTEECDRTCNNEKRPERRKRSSGAIYHHQVTLGQVIYVYDPYEKDKDKGDDFDIIIDAGTTRTTTSRVGNTTTTITPSPASTPRKVVGTGTIPGSSTASSQMSSPSSNLGEPDRDLDNGDDKDDRGNGNTASSLLRSSQILLLLLLACRQLFMQTL